MIFRCSCILHKTMQSVYQKDKGKLDLLKSPVESILHPLNYTRCGWARLRCVGGVERHSALYPSSMKWGGLPIIQPLWEGFYIACFSALGCEGHERMQEWACNSINLWIKLIQIEIKVSCIVFKFFEESAPLSMKNYFLFYQRRSRMK